MADDTTKRDYLQLYQRSAHRVQTAIAMLMGRPGGYNASEPKHLRVGIDMQKADQLGLARLLMEKGVFTETEYLEAVTATAEQEADQYEKAVQAVLGNRKVQTL